MIDVPRTTIPRGSSAPITNDAKVVIVIHVKGYLELLVKRLLENDKFPELPREPFGKDRTANGLPWRVKFDKFTELSTKAGELKINVIAIIVELNGSKQEVIFNLLKVTPSNIPNEGKTLRVLSCWFGDISGNTQTGMAGFLGK